MKKQFLRLLSTVSDSGELSISEAVKCLDRKTNTHIDLYPLALLIEDGYLGLSHKHEPPSGAEEMREYSLAISLHMLCLPKNEKGYSEYNGITSHGSMNPNDEKIFIKAKGHLYLEEIAEKRWDRIVYFCLGLLSVVAAQWLISIFSLSNNAN